MPEFFFRVTIKTYRRTLLPMTIVSVPKIIAETKLKPTIEFAQIKKSSCEDKSCRNKNCTNNS